MFGIESLQKMRQKVCKKIHQNMREFLNKTKTDLCIASTLLQDIPQSSATQPALKKISVMHVIKLGFAPVSFPPG